MGKEGCLDILLGAYPRLAPLNFVHVFLPRHIFARSFWIKANLKITKSNQRVYFLACPDCSKACGASYKNEFTCLYCNRDYPTTKPRLRFEVELFDGTGNLNAVVEQREAQMLLGMSGEEIIELEMKGNQLKTADINKRFNKWQLLFHIRTSIHDFRGEKSARNTIIACLSPPNTPLPSHQEKTSSSIAENSATNTSTTETQQSSSATPASLLQKNPSDHLPKSTGKRSFDATTDAEQKDPKFTKQDYGTHGESSFYSILHPTLDAQYAYISPVF